MDQLYWSAKYHKFIGYELQLLIKQVVHPIKAVSRILHIKAMKKDEPSFSSLLKLPSKMGQSSSHLWGLTNNRSAFQCRCVLAGPNNAECLDFRYLGIDTFPPSIDWSCKNTSIQLSQPYLGLHIKFRIHHTMNKEIIYLVLRFVRVPSLPTYLIKIIFNDLNNLSILLGGFYGPMASSQFLSRNFYLVQGACKVWCSYPLD